MEIEKLQNHYFDIEEIMLTTENDFTINKALISHLFLKDLPTDRINVFVNTLINRGILVPLPTKKIFKYRPEHSILNFDDLTVVTEHKQLSNYKDAFLALLVTTYMVQHLVFDDVRFKWLINTLNEYDILKNVYDPMNKQAENFQELFEE